MLLNNLVYVSHLKKKKPFILSSVSKREGKLNLYSIYWAIWLLLYLKVNSRKKGKGEEAHIRERGTNENKRCG